MFKVKNILLKYPLCIKMKSLKLFITKAKKDLLNSNYK